MKKVAVKFAAACLVGVMLATSSPYSAAASTLNSELPAAGAARALSEGKSVTALRAEKILATGKVDASDVSAVTLAAEESAEKESSESKTEKSSKSEESSETPSAGAGNYETETDGDLTTSSTQATAGDPEESADSDNSKKEEKSKSKSKSSVKADEAESISAGAGTEVKTDDDDDGDMNLVDAVTKAENEKEEEYEDLVVAQVDNFVNVRTEASEDSEVAGKLYANSVGENLGTKGDWIKIRSGNTEGYVKSEFVVTGDKAKELAKKVGTRTARVTTTTLYVRQDHSTEAEVLGMVPMDDQLTVLEETDDGWAKVSIEEGEGYVNTQFVHLFTEYVYAESKAEEEARLAREEAEREAAREAARKAAEKAAKNSSKGGKSSSKGGASGKSSSGSSGGVSYSASGSGSGSSVANYALKFVGNPYVYGGTSLTNGADCSGFVMSVYRNFGISLPHSSGADRSVGSAVSGGLANAQAGDIVCYSGHVAIYIGNGQIVHASTAKTGIKVSNANYRTPVAVRRVF
ncbi:Cell wall-associated hydrolase, NlpC family [Lachnospiraceae bacterium]|nr:Cell wall-associated hydrolase, NlpC family [Lachnospiraceae bacterium]